MFSPSLWDARGDVLHMIELNNDGLAMALFANAWALVTARGERLAFGRVGMA